MSQEALPSTRIFIIGALSTTLALAWSDAVKTGFDQVMARGNRLTFATLFGHSQGRPERGAEERGSQVVNKFIYAGTLTAVSVLTLKYLINTRLPLEKPTPLLITQ